MLVRSRTRASGGRRRLSLSRLELNWNFRATMTTACKFPPVSRLKSAEENSIFQRQRALQLREGRRETIAETKCGARFCQHAHCRLQRSAQSDADFRPANQLKATFWACCAAVVAVARSRAAPEMDDANNGKLRADDNNERQPLSQDEGGTINSSASISSHFTLRSPIKADSPERHL